MFAAISIRAKIISVLAFLLVAMTGMGLLAVAKMRSMNANTVEITTSWMPSVRVRRGRTLEVWGCVRPANRYPRGAVGRVQIQLNGRTIRSVRITNPNGYFDVHVAFPGSGNVRLAWNYPHGARIYSRTVRVTG